MRKILVFVVLLVYTIMLMPIYTYDLGIGRADCTGPPVEIAFMGYAQLKQKGDGIHLRQFSRAFIIQNDLQRLIFVSVDAAMMTHPVKRDVVRELQRKYGTIYRMDNIVISGTHTHSAPGGFNMFLLYDLPTLGFVRETFQALVHGITLSIVNAHNNMQKGRLFLSEIEIDNANINRSPSAYLNNPTTEREKYQGNTDTKLTQLRFMDEYNKKVLAAINFFSVHPTSMNNSNQLVSTDNMGFASILLEQEYNPHDLIGKGDFVGAFASTNLGDVSPNIMGPKCHRTGLSCDALTSSCPNKDVCFASGPGRNMFDSTRIIAKRIYSGASKLLQANNGREITGELKFVHQFVDVPKAREVYRNLKTNRTESFKGCLPALGYSFAAGTTDGQGAFDFKQGSLSGNLLWNTIRNLIAAPTIEDQQCQSPKPILFATGRSVIPYEWQPHIVPTQLFVIGSLVLVAVSGEFTTMAGRRLKSDMKLTAQSAGFNFDVVIAGLSNMYTSYIATPEEYQVQRYEGASTLYGPNTLTIYIQQYQKLLNSVLNNQILSSGPQPPIQDNKQISLSTLIFYDFHPLNSNFGNVKFQPKNFYQAGEIVYTKFVSGNPRNNLMHESSYFTVEKMQANGSWKIIATDANWETSFKWKRTSIILGLSEIEFFWYIQPKIEPGSYIVRHFGYYKYIFGGVYPYHGRTKQFFVGN